MSKTTQRGAGQPNEDALAYERLQSLVNSMADGVIAVDDEIRIVLYNGAALNLLDSNRSITGQRLDKAVKLFDANRQPIDVFELVRQTAVPTSTRDLLLHYPDGSTSNVYLSIAPVRLGYGSGGDKGFVLLLRDITREKSLEEERNEFISVVSHELRTPIAIAEGNISNVEFLLQKAGSADAAIVEALKLAHHQVLFLADMINDLSTLSRAEQGKLVLEVNAINLHKMCSDIVASHRQEAEAKGLQLRANLHPHLETLNSSELYVREILQNFITNALKYTDTGSIILDVRPKDEGVLFLVSDTGIGISKSDQERVFDKFFRSEDFRTRATNGTGLGLYVTMKLARLLHATISLESHLNKGSVFSIYIPNMGNEPK